MEDKFVLALHKIGDAKKYTITYVNPGVIAWKRGYCVDRILVCRLVITGTISMYIFNPGDVNTPTIYNTSIHSIRSTASGHGIWYELLVKEVDDKVVDMDTTALEELGITKYVSTSALEIINRATYDELAHRG